MKCAICGKPLPKYGTIWEPAEGIYTHMNTRCPKSFDYPAHDALLPDCHEDHDLFEHRGVMHYATFEPYHEGGTPCAAAHWQADRKAEYDALVERCL